MKINKIKISGFRSINEAIEIQFTQIAALIGANNTGKSNILSAIYKVLGRDWVTVNNFDESDVYRQEFNKDIEIEVEFSEPLLYNQYVGIDPIEIPKLRFKYTRYKRGDRTGQRRLEKSCLTASDRPVQILVKKPKAGEQRQYQPLTTIPQDIQESINLIYIGIDRSLKYQLPNSRNSLLGSLMNDIDKDFRNPENKIIIKDESGNNQEITRKKRFNQCIEEAISTLRTEEFNELEKSIKENALHQLGFDSEIDSDKLDIFFHPMTSLDFYKSLEIWVKEHDYNMNASNLGGGFQNAIVIAILKAFEERRKKGAIFLIEEPEMYLHPQMQRSLYKTLRQIGESNQVIYITHSSNFVTIPEFNEIVIVKKPNSTKITQSTLEATHRLKEKFRKELDAERNELFFATRILFVEGDTEKLALPEYAIRENMDFDKVGASIIEVGGKRSLVDFIDIALSFDITVGFVYDIDSSDFDKDKKDEESEYNILLEGYADKGVKVWNFDRKFEDELKKFVGDVRYQQICQKYPNVSKPIRARLIASDNAVPVPHFVKPIIMWLANKEEEQ